MTCGFYFESCGRSAVLHARVAVQCLFLLLQGSGRLYALRNFSNVLTSLGSLEFGDLYIRGMRCCTALVKQSSKEICILGMLSCVA